MPDLVMDGREVLFSSASGEFQCSATSQVVISEAMAATKNKSFGMLPDHTFGLWPDIRFNPTGWQEL